MSREHRVITELEQSREEKTGRARGPSLLHFPSPGGCGTCSQTIPGASPGGGGAYTLRIGAGVGKSPSSPNPDAVCEIARHAGFFPPLWFAFAHGINTMNVTCGICILSPDSYIPLPADSSTWVSNVRLR